MQVTTFPIHTMRAITPGHTYTLAHHDHNPDAINSAGTTEYLAFVRKERMGDGKFVTVQNGTTNEEVITCLIDRIEFLNSKMPCDENAAAIQALQLALKCLNIRTAKRQARGVEGTDTV